MEGLQFENSGEYGEHIYDHYSLVQSDQESYLWVKNICLKTIDIS